MAEFLGQPLSDGSFWAINLNITKTSTATSDKALKMDLRFNRTRIVVFQDQHGNPRHSKEFRLLSTMVPTLHLPGSMNRSEYYTALQQWLQSLNGDLPLEGNVVNDLTEWVMERAFGRVDGIEKVSGICVGADLHRVSLEYEDIPTEEDDESEDEEEEEGLMDYVEALSEFYRVGAADEEQCRFGDCSICLEGLVPVGKQLQERAYNKYVLGTPCGHFFHKKCMAKWLRMSDSCPLCRFDI